MEIILLVCSVNFDVYRLKIRIDWKIFQQKSNKSPSDRDIHECQTKTAGNDLEIACNLSKPGKHKVLVFSRGRSSTALGEFKFTAIKP